MRSSGVKSCVKPSQVLYDGWWNCAEEGPQHTEGKWNVKLACKKHSKKKKKKRKEQRGNVVKVEAADKDTLHFFTLFIISTPQSAYCLLYGLGNKECN